MATTPSPALGFALTFSDSVSAFSLQSLPGPHSMTYQPLTYQPFPPLFTQAFTYSLICYLIQQKCNKHLRSLHVYPFFIFRRPIESPRLRTVQAEAQTSASKSLTQGTATHPTGLHISLMRTD